MSSALHGSGLLTRYVLLGESKQMELKFRVPARRTRIRFFSDVKALKSALSSLRGAYMLQDDGLPFPSRYQKITGGEITKTWDRLGALLEALANARVERKQPLVVLGGGAVTDLAAMAASTYRRGIPLILVPSTLVGMVDAAIGGKTAIDHGRLKNFAGTFYPANEVWICPDLLRTLPLRERVSGAGELWKTLWITGAIKNDLSIMHFVLHGKVEKALKDLIKKAIAEKIRIVERDPLDLDRIREVLNFGHTVGHVLEANGDGLLAHGEAVLWGMAVEAQLLGKSGAKMQKEIRRVILDLGLEMPPAFTAEDVDWGSFLLGDKKMHGGKIRMSVLAAPGQVKKIEVSTDRVIRAMKSFPESFQP